MIIRKYFTVIALITLVMGYTVSAFGAVSPEEAKKLGTTLTEIGAEKAGNADGSIPAYTGGLTESPKGYVKGSGIRPDPFAGEKPLFSIDAKNMNQYSNRLTEGVKALMVKYPTFRIDVYKTHRTVAFPEYVMSNTKKVALTATTAKGGLALQNAHAAYPFPIPADGIQALWNHLVRFVAPNAYINSYDVYYIDSTGVETLSQRAIHLTDSPYWDTSKEKVEAYLRMRVTYTGPPRRYGEGVVGWDSLDFDAGGRHAWSYLPGQRRVRLAPDMAFDTPNPGTAGGTTYDDSRLFSGSPERYDWKLIGKKEIYIPYNTYKLTYSKGDVNKVMNPKHLNPDFVRWELHRVWVVEATLKPGKRHIYKKRVLYLDEDSWMALEADVYDKRGNMFRVMLAYMAPSYDVPAPNADMITANDLIARTYMCGMWPRNDGIKYIGKVNAQEMFSPESLAAEGLR